MKMRVRISTGSMYLNAHVRLLRTFISKRCHKKLQAMVRPTAEQMTLT